MSKGHSITGPHWPGDYSACETSLKIRRKVQFRKIIRKKIIVALSSTGSAKFSTTGLGQDRVHSSNHHQGNVLKKIDGGVPYGVDDCGEVDELFEDSLRPSRDALP
ncbi:hypothetical protein Y032_0094g2782 [Ancylostoma ceylanicum]|uniref:Uncharacterized protein n=1 Tax=Ancylostoma ceylanicum TaxID=53326 RepID=A0A016TKF7_9BILA|nr:hypothetical protein Y032_0094g2782 [Ancylostoma ceylanicum]